jgi:hypothetical protein
MKNFKKEWNREDFTKAQKAITKYFKGKVLINHRNEKVLMPSAFRGIESVIGLPYTSSSSYAMQSMDCNVHLNAPEFPGYHYDHAAISEDDRVVLILQDKNENQEFIQI